MGNKRIFSHVLPLGQQPFRSVLLLCGMIGLLVGCTKVPEGVQPVSGFELPRFLGKWYEIARLDHGFERNLQNVTAEYVAGEDGEIKVLNRGFNEKTGQWAEDDAVAKMAGEGDVGSLKVSFFGPFWGGYHIIALDRENYGYAMVTGPSKSLLWILARDKTLDDKTLGTLISQATKWGYDTKKLIYVKHGEPQQKPAEQPQPAASTLPAPAN
ncbi:MAG: lipocalin [Proteobacteria bacterium]|nr:lipocalin [Pseudomonadota bacterium]